MGPPPDRPGRERSAGPAATIVEGLKGAGVSLAAYVPDSLLRSTFRLLREDPDIRTVQTSNEADLPGIVVGAYLGGVRAVLMMENSGIRQGCEPIARFTYSYRFPMVMLLSHRGGFPEPTWWGHAHAQTMAPILDALRVPWRLLETPEEVGPAVAGAFTHSRSSQWPVALVLSGECLER
ncbi:MAG TPA: sulfopyruvate decarboxylase [Actinomycetota bacterium]